MYAEASTRLGLGAGADRAAAGGVRDLLPPGPVADLLIYMYWTANARNAEEGRNVFAAGRGRTRIGETMSHAAADPELGPALSRSGDLPVRQFDVYSEDGTSWTFDAGPPVTETTWIDRGVPAS